MWRETSRMHICVCLRVISIEVCWNWNHTPQIPITVHQPAGSGTNTQKREDPRESRRFWALSYVLLCFSRARFRSCVHVMCTAHTSHTRTQTHRQGMAHAISITVCVGTRCVPSVATRVCGSQDLQTPFFITQHTPTCDLGGGAAYLTLTSR